MRVRVLALAVLFALFSGGTADAQYTLYWFNGHWLCNLEGDDGFFDWGLGIGTSGSGPGCGPGCTTSEGGSEGGRFEGRSGLIVTFTLKSQTAQDATFLTPASDEWYMKRAGGDLTKGWAVRGGYRVHFDCSRGLHHTPTTVSPAIQH